MKAEEPISIPLDVLPDSDDEYRKNDQKISCRTGILMWSGGAGEVKCLNDNLSGTVIPADDENPELLFTIYYSQVKTGTCTRKPELVTRFGNDDIPEQGIIITGATSI